MGRRTTISLSTGLGVVFLAAFWVLFAPVTIGGPLDYVIVNGNSMEPNLHKGDLVLVRVTDDYHVGDVVTYRHPQIGPVIHRIEARDGDKYVFKGDHNTWLDSYEPTASELIGKQWIRIPGFGRLLSKLRGPRNLAILAGVMGVIVMSSIGKKTQTQPAARSKRPLGHSFSQSPVDRQVAVEWLKLLAIVAVAAALVAAYGFSKSPQRATRVEAAYTQTGQFSYTASTGAANGIYDQDSAASGEPVFRQISDSVDVNFRYDVSADDPSTSGAFGGTWQLMAEVSDINGWKRSIPLTDETTFSGSHFDASASLAFADVQALIDRVEAQTGVERSQYELAIVPRVRLNGAVAGQTLTDSFAPRLEFLLDDLQLQLAPPDPDAASPLTPSSAGAVAWASTATNSLSFLSLHLPVSMVRMASLAILALALTLLFLGWLGMTFLLQSPDAERASDSAETAIVEVQSWSDLVALSQRFGAPVEARGEGRTSRHIVEASGLTYQYSESGARPGPVA